MKSFFSPFLSLFGILLIASGAFAADVKTVLGRLDLELAEQLAGWDLTRKQIDPAPPSGYQLSFVNRLKTTISLRFFGSDAAAKEFFESKKIHFEQRNRIPQDGIALNTYVFQSVNREGPDEAHILWHQGSVGARISSYNTRSDADRALAIVIQAAQGRNLNDKSGHAAFLEALEQGIEKIEGVHVLKWGIRELTGGYSWTSVVGTIHLDFDVMSSNDDAQRVMAYNLQARSVIRIDNDTHRDDLGDEGYYFKTSPQRCNLYFRRGSVFVFARGAPAELVLDTTKVIDALLVQAR